MISDPGGALDLAEAFDRSVQDLLLALQRLPIPDSVPAFTLVRKPESEDDIRDFVNTIVSAAGLPAGPPAVLAAWDRMKRAGDHLGTRLIEQEGNGDS